MLNVEKDVNLNKDEQEKESVIFSDPGKKLKDVAKVAFWLLFIGGMGYIVYTVVNLFKKDPGEALMTLALGFVIVLAISFLSTIALYAFGHLVETQEKAYKLQIENSKKLDDIKKSLDNKQ